MVVLSCYQLSMSENYMIAAAAAAAAKDCFLYT